MKMVYDKPPFSSGQVGGASRKRPIEWPIARQQRGEYERILEAVKIGSASNEDICTLSQLPAFIGVLVRRGVLLEDEHGQAAIEYAAALDRESSGKRFGFTGTGIRLMQKMIEDFEDIAKGIWAHEYMKAWNQVHAMAKQFVNK